MKRYASAVVLVLGLAAAGCGHDDGSSRSSQAGTAAPYENQLIRRQGTTLEDSKVYLVQNGRKRWIVNGSWIKAHGFAWPGDVHVISREEVDKFPTGEPITDKS